MNDKEFFARCKKAVDGKSAYEFLVRRASVILGQRGHTNECLYKIVDYYFENEEHFDCSFEEWLSADNGPIVRYGIKGLFPELELVAKNTNEIIKLAKKYYGVELEFDWEGDYVYSLEFNFKEVNSKRVDLDEVKAIAKAIVLEKLEKEV